MIDRLVDRHARRRPHASRASTSRPSPWCARCAPAGTEQAVLYVNLAGLDQRRRRRRHGLPLHARRRRWARRDRADALRAPRPHDGARSRLDAARRPRRRRSRRSRATPSSSRPSARRSRRACTRSPTRVRNSLNFYRMQDSAETGRARRPHGPGRRDPRLRRRARRRSCTSPSSPPSSATDEEGADAGRLTVAAGLALGDTP